MCLAVYNVAKCRKPLEKNQFVSCFGNGKRNELWAAGQIPVITKENYFKKYSIPERCWNGDIAFVDFLHCSSGSSGHPQLWPRSIQDEVNVTSAFELVFHDAFNAHKLNTLVIICFPLGSWVGGIFTVKCLSYLSLKVFHNLECISFLLELQLSWNWDSIMWVDRATKWLLWHQGINLMIYISLQSIWDICMIRWSLQDIRLLLREL